MSRDLLCGVSGKSAERRSRIIAVAISGMTRGGRLGGVGAWDSPLRPLRVHLPRPAGEDISAWGRGIASGKGFRFLKENARHVRRDVAFPDGVVPAGADGFGPLVGAP